MLYWSIIVIDLGIAVPSDMEEAYTTAQYGNAFWHRGSRHYSQVLQYSTNAGISN